MLSGRGLCDELITRPEEPYRLCCVVVCDLETSRMGAPYIYIYIYIYIYDIGSLRVNQPDINAFFEFTLNAIRRKMHDTLQSIPVVLSVTNHTRILVVGRELKR